MTLPDPFFQFDGTAGRYLKKEDVNLLDADSAHFVQSIGTWVSSFSFIGFQTSTALTPVFGPSHLQAEVSGTLAQMITAEGTAGVPVSPSTDYAYTVSLATDSTVLPQLVVRVFEYDAGGVLLVAGAEIVVQQSAVVDTWYTSTYQFTSHPSAAFVAVIARINDCQTGDKLYVDAVCLSPGTAPAFVPSLRIVGDLDLRADVNPLGSATIQHFVAHWQASTQARSAYRLYISGAGPGNGILWVTWRDSVGTAYNFSASAVVAFGTRATYRTTLTAAGAYELFVNGVSVASGSSGIGNPLNQATSILECGSRLIGTNGLFGGDMYSAEVRDGIDGPVVARFDPDDRLGL